MKDPDTGKRRSRPNPETLWVITHVPELQIIDQDTWDNSQSLKQRYSCSTKREKGTCDNPAGIQAERLEARVIDGLKNILLGRDDLLEAFASAFFEETVRLRRERNRQRQTQQKELAKVQRSIDRCLDFIINGDGAMERVRQKLSDLEHSKTDILRLMDQVTSPTKVESHPLSGNSINAAWNNSLICLMMTAASRRL